MSNIFYWVKKDLFGVFLDIEGDNVTIDNENRFEGGRRV